MATYITAKSTRHELGIEYREHKKGGYRTITVHGKPSSRWGRREFIGIRGGMLKSDANALAAKYRRMGYLARVTKDPTSNWAHSVYVWKGM